MYVTASCWSLFSQHYTFYDFLVNKARGKSGPLFNFDVHDDVRMIQDASVEKDEVRKLALSTSRHADWLKVARRESS